MTVIVDTNIVISALITPNTKLAQLLADPDLLNKRIRGVDNKDISFVALALQTGGWLWTGDKKLSLHLKTMGFDRVLNTSELYGLLEG